MKKIILAVLALFVLFSCEDITPIGPHPDAEAPEITVFTVPSAVTVNQVDLTITATDNKEVTGWYVDSVAQGTPVPAAPFDDSLSWLTAEPSSYTLPSAGSHTIYLYVKDAFGNISDPAQADVIFSIPDTTAPSITTFSTVTITTDANPVVTVIASDDQGVTGWYLVIQDASAVAPSTPVANSPEWNSTKPTSLSLGSYGDYKAYLWAKDAAGNISAMTELSITYQDATPVDNEAPVITSFTSAATTTTVPVAVTITASDNVGITAWFLEVQSASAAAPSAPDAAAPDWFTDRPSELTFPAYDDYKAYLWAKDSAGNVSARAELSITYEDPTPVDTTAPLMASFTINNAGVSNLNVPIISLDASDDTAVTAYYLSESSVTPAADASGWGSAPSSFSIADYGSFTIYAWAKDAVGNVSSSLSVSGEANRTIVMYYGAADNDLEYFLYCDLNEIQSVDMSSAGVKTIALFDRGKTPGDDFTKDDDWQDTRAFEITGDNANTYNGFTLALQYGRGLKRIAVPSLNITTTSTAVELAMDDPDVLEKFVSFCKSEYVADNYMLIISNHGGGWRDEEAESESSRSDINKAIAWDDTSMDSNPGVDNSLYMSEVRTALTNALAGDKLDILAFDACNMGMAEVIYELRGVTDYIIASQEAIPGRGYPYTQIYQAYAANPSYTMTQLGTMMCDTFVDIYENGGSIEYPSLIDNAITLTMYDTSKIDPLVTAVNSLGTQLNTSYSDIDARLMSLSMAGFDYVDLGDYLAKEASGLYTTDQVGSYGAAVETALANLIVHHAKPTTGPYVDTTGLAIYFPADMRFYSREYTAANIQFASAASGWQKFISTTAPADTSIDDTELDSRLIFDNGTTAITAADGLTVHPDDMDVHLVANSAGYTKFVFLCSEPSNYKLRVEAYDAADNYIGMTYINNSTTTGINEIEEFNLSLASGAAYYLVAIIPVEFDTDPTAAAPVSYTIGILK